MEKENEFIEFKKTTNEIKEAMISISSILNKHGHGTIYFGLKNDGSPFKFTINDSTLRDISRKVFEAIKPQIYPTIETILIENIEVIKVDFEGKEKPYSAFGKYYVRVADEDREMSPSELRKMMIAQEYEENWENKTSNEDILDVSNTTLTYFYDNATNCGRLPDLGSDNVLLLEKLGLVNGKQLTNAGKILFSKNKPISLKMAVFATEHKTTFLDISRVEGNIFELISAATSYIIKNIRWSSKISDDGIHRIETPEIPIDAIREAVINSFAHARYDSNLQHEICIYSNRITITNPGSFANEYKPEDFVSRDLHSFLRNEIIAKVLYLCKDVETFGSGLKKIYTLCNDAGIRVTYENTENYFTFEFSREDRNRLRQDESISTSLNKNESEVLDILRSNNYITVKEMVEITKKSKRTLDRTIHSLKEKKLIERIGSNKTGYWRIL